MDPTHAPEEKNGTKTNLALRRMGMSLSVVGAIIFSAGLVACWHSAEGQPNTRCVSIFVFGLALLASGLYTWLNAKKAD